MCCLKRDKRGEMSLILENPGNDRRRDSITRINLRRNSNAGLKMARKNRYGSECQEENSELGPWQLTGHLRLRRREALQASLVAERIRYCNYRSTRSHKEIHR